MSSKKQIKLYTKTGDGGESGLGRGERVPKSEAVFEVLGTIDELNAFVGLAASGVRNDKEGNLRRELLRIQRVLLKCGAVIGGGTDLSGEIEKEVVWLEKRIDEYQGQFGEDWYKRFLLPGGVELAARLDVARTVCRRAERVWTRFKDRDLRFRNEMRVVGRYLNRLSDYLFAARCYVNWKEEYKEREFGVDK